MKDPHNKFHLLDGIPPSPGNVSLGAVIDELRSRKLT